MSSLPASADSRFLPCRSSCSCATGSCWTSGCCRRTSPTSWRAPWSTTPATGRKSGVSSATCSCTSGTRGRLDTHTDTHAHSQTPSTSNSFSLPVACPPLSLEQLGFNALLQLMIGVPLEMVHGILRISLLYMAGVLAGRCLEKRDCDIFKLLFFGKFGEFNQIFLMYFLVLFFAVKQFNLIRLWIGKTKTKNF